MNIVGCAPELAPASGGARGDGFSAERAEKDSNAELAERIERRARRGRHVKILGVLLSEPFAAPRSGGRRGWFQTPSSPSVFLQISRGPWRARRFRSSRRPLVGTVRGTAERRSPRTVSNAELAERAEHLPGNFSGPLRARRFRSSRRHHLFISTLRRRQVLEKWCRCGGSIKSISVERDFTQSPACRITRTRKRA